MLPSGFPDYTPPPLFGSYSPGVRAHSPPKAIRCLLFPLAGLHPWAPMRSPVSTGNSAACRLRGSCPTCLSLSFGPSATVPGSTYLLLRLSDPECLTSFCRRHGLICPLLTSALRSGRLSAASVAEATQGRSPGVSSAAFRAQSPDLRFAPLMDMDFAVSCPLVRRSRLISGFCPSTRTFANASFRPRLAAAALASSLALHLHQVGRRTFTSKPLNMPSTQRTRSRGCAHRLIARGRALRARRCSGWARR